MDFDRLRKGVIHPSVFVRGMSLAGLDKVLSTAELWLIRDHYTQQEAPTLEAFCYRDFLADVDAIFTQQVGAVGCWMATHARMAGWL